MSRPCRSILRRCTIRARACSWCQARSSAGARSSARRFCEGAELRCLSTPKLSGRRLSSADRPGSTLVTKWPSVLSIARRPVQWSSGPMSQRRFLVASSLARLIRKEQGVAGRLVEGYFPPRPDRDHFVSLEPGHAYLVLAPLGGAGEAERTEVPRSQAEALLAVCAGQVGFEGTIVPLRDGQQALLQRFVAPGPLDLLSVAFAAGEDADGFVPPAWFGPEVTQNPAYHRGSLARTGLPASEDIPLSNAMLEELLDVIEEGTIAAQLGRGSSPSVHDEPPAEGPSDGPFPTELPAPSVESVEADGLMAGLAEALKDVQPTRAASAADDAAAREGAPVERARPRLLKGGWR